MITTKSEVIPAGKIKCFVTGKLRKDTPEEHVRQRMARSLVDEYGYDRSDFDIEFIITMGRARKRADIVIFEPGADHRIENIKIIVEAKKTEIKPSHLESGIDQLKAYLSAAPNAKYGLWVGSEFMALERVVTKGIIKFEQIPDLPFADGRQLEEYSFSALVPATDALKDVFRRCHNYIAANQGFSKEAAFHEFLKITFCKVYDERMSDSPHFFISPKDQRTAVGQKKLMKRLEELFEDVCDDYGYIFGSDDRIKLNPHVAAYLVKELQKYNLLETDFDYKGQAYEEIVGANSRGDRGEFFTPRNLCALATKIAKTIIGSEQFKKLRLLDPACGTGGFLRAYVNELYTDLLSSEEGKWGKSYRAKEKAKVRLKTICDRGTFGIDFNPVLVRAAQMNLVMHGDGSANIFHENSLLSCGEWNSSTHKRIKDGSFDLIMTNPPFGEALAVDDPHVLHQYELSSFERGGSRPAVPPQELFIERCLRLLKGEGLLIIVTPDNILSNPNTRSIRRWLLLKYQLICSISLPGEMFQPHTGTRTSLLVLKKLRTPFFGLEDLFTPTTHPPVFMAVPKKVGHDQRGAFLPARDELGDIVLKEVERTKYKRKGSTIVDSVVYTELERVADDHIPKVFEEFSSWYQTNKHLL
jgi:type I restriction enzyme M protein